MSRPVTDTEDHYPLFFKIKRLAAEEEKRKAGEAKALREAAKKLVKKERQRLRAINEGQGVQARPRTDFVAPDPTR